MKLFHLLAASFLALPLAGCNTVPTNCKDLATSVLRQSYKDAPKNAGTYIKYITLYDSPSANYIIDIDATGKISQGWWSVKDSTESTSVVVYRNPNITSSPPIPLPEMSNSSGIVCKLGVLDNSITSKTNGTLRRPLIDTVSQDENGYSVKY